MTHNNPDIPGQLRHAMDSRLLDTVLAAHRRSSYDAGYSRALADVLAATVFAAEHALRAAPHSAEARAVLYRFVADLEAHTRRLASGEGFVSDGAGI